MIPTFLFVYGTLRHDQPEHRKYCRGVVGWRPARVGGRLDVLPEGYLISLVSQNQVLGYATTDAVADEVLRGSLSRPENPPRTVGSAPWIVGELLEFRDAVRAWPPLDRWEGFVPGRTSTYQRMIISVELTDPLEGEARATPAWIYARIGALRAASPEFLA